MKKEIPILFSTPMVEALIAGRKIMTRRIMKPQPVKTGGFWEWAGAGWSFDGPVTPVLGHSLSERCRYGRPGDILWVRETCSAHEQPDGLDGVLYKACASFIEIEDSQEAVDKWMALRHYGNGQYKDVPSIHMPKWAARIWLEVVNVRVERLQSISQEDAKSEGVFTAPHRCPGWKNQLLSFADCYICPYKILWNQINGESGFNWDSNPWVWCVEYKVLSTTGKPK